MAESVVDTERVVANVFNIPTAAKLVDLQPSGEAVPFPEVISFDYFESLHEPFISAKLTVLDSAGLVDTSFDNCGVRQFCPVEITVEDASNGNEWARNRPKLEFVGANCFYVNRVVNQVIKGKKKQYTLELVNRDSIVALSKNVKSSWPPDDSTKVDYNTIVKDLLTKYVATAKDTTPVMAEMTEVIPKLQGHNFKVYELLNAMCKYATPKGSDGSGEEETRPAGYVFYETYGEYRFDPLLKLLTNPSRLDDKKGTTYAVQAVNTPDIGPEDAVQTIISYRFYDSDSQSSLLEEYGTKTRGKPRVTAMDVQRNTFKKIEKLPPKTITDKCLKAASDGDLTSVTYKEQTEYQLEYYNTCDEGALDNEPTNPELTSMNYGALLDMLKSKVSTIKVPGNFSLSVGDHLNIDIPLIKGDSGNEAEASDKYSGAYVITRINHKISEITHAYSIIDICKLVDN